MGSWTYTYDTLNRLVSRDVIGVGAATYLHDAEGRICAVQSGTVNGMPLRIGYIYDADGNRVARGSIASMSCDPGSNGFQFTESYVLDTNGEELTMLDGNGNWQRTNIFGGGRQLATYDSNGLHFQVTDPLGTRRVQTNAVGNPKPTSRACHSATASTPIQTRTLQPAPTMPRRCTSPAKNAIQNQEMTTSGLGTTHPAWAGSYRPIRSHDGAPFG